MPVKRPSGDDDDWFIERGEFLGGHVGNLGTDPAVASKRRPRRIGSRPRYRVLADCVLVTRVEVK